MKFALAATAVVGAAAVQAPSNLRSGQSNNKKRVINGIPTNGEIWRGTVLVNAEGGGGCSGSYIHPRLILTAEHCCSGSSQTGMSAKTGAFGDIELGNTLGHVSAPLGIVNDICLMHMEKDKPADIPYYDVHRENVAVGSDTVIVGYGLNISSILGPTDGFGEARYGLTTVSGFRMNGMSIQARAGTSPQQNACNGDSGGPVFAEAADGRWMVHGVTSRGMAGCPVTATATYVNSAVNTDWIVDSAAGFGHTLGNTRDGACTTYEC